MKRWIHAATVETNPLDVIYNYLEETNKNFSSMSEKAKRYKVATIQKQFERNSNPYSLHQGLAYLDKEVAAHKEASRLWEEARQNYLDAVASVQG